MRLVQGDFTCPACGVGTCRVVIDDGLPPGESDAGTLRATALRIAKKHGGWACDHKGCEFKFPLTGDLLSEIAKVTAVIDHHGFADIPADVVEDDDDEERQG